MQSQSIGKARRSTPLIQPTTAFTDLTVKLDCDLAVVQRAMPSLRKLSMSAGLLANAQQLQFTGIERLDIGARWFSQIHQCLPPDLSAMKLTASMPDLQALDWSRSDWLGFKRMNPRLQLALGVVVCADNDFAHNDVVRLLAKCPLMVCCNVHFRNGWNRVVTAEQLDEIILALCGENCPMLQCLFLDLDSTQIPGLQNLSKLDKLMQALGLIVNSKPNQEASLLLPAAVDCIPTHLIGLILITATEIPARSVLSAIQAVLKRCKAIQVISVDTAAVSVEPGKSYDAELEATRLARSGTGCRLIFSFKRKRNVAWHQLVLRLLKQDVAIAAPSS